METSLPRPIVVGVDGSESSARAVRWAALEATRVDAPLQLVSAWQTPVTTSWAALSTPSIDPSLFEGNAAEVVRVAKAQVTEDMGADAPPMTGATAAGPPASALLDAAQHASLLVVGTRGRGGLASAVLGSVSTTCAHHTPVPLVVVGADAPDPGTGGLVVGFDGSPGARAALRWAVADARASGAAVQVTHAWTSPIGEPFGSLPDDPGLHDPTPAIERAVAETLADEGDLPSISVHVVPAPAARYLIERAKGEAALVVGSRGHGGFVGLLLGSVSQSLLHHSPCPLVIVPPPAAED